MCSHMRASAALPANPRAALVRRVPAVLCATAEPMSTMAVVSVRAGAGRACLARSHIVTLTILQYRYGRAWDGERAAPADNPAR